MPVSEFKCIQIRHCRYVQKYFLVFKHQLCHVSFAVNRTLQNQSDNTFSIKKHNTQRNSILLKNNLKYRTIPLGRKAISVVHSVNTQVECCSPGLSFSNGKTNEASRAHLFRIKFHPPVQWAVLACGRQNCKMPPPPAHSMPRPGNLGLWYLSCDVMFYGTADLKIGRLSQWS